MKSYWGTEMTQAEARAMVKCPSCDGFGSFRMPDAKRTQVRCELCSGRGYVHQKIADDFEKEKAAAEEQER